MFICRLFHKDQPFEPIDARLLAEGELTIGRDRSAGWPLADPDGVLSRIHCSLSVEDGRLVLRDCSTNGTFLEDGRRLTAGETVTLDARQSVRLGPLMLVVDDAPIAAVASTAATHPGSPATLPRDWTDAPGAPAAPPPAHRDASLLEAFCEGARLDPSALSDEDPVELMRRLGAIYQQTVLGLATLIAERSRLKSAHELDRTTIAPAANNPFKWTPSRRLAQDLLTPQPQGYLAGVDAVRASFADVVAHVGAVAEAADGAVAAVVAQLSPESIGAEVDGRGFSLRSRAAACWDVHAQRHAAIAEAAPGQGFAGEAFRSAYARAAGGAAPE